MPVGTSIWHTFTKVVRTVNNSSRLRGLLLYYMAPMSSRITGMIRISNTGILDNSNFAMPTVLYAINRPFLFCCCVLAIC